MKLNNNLLLLTLMAVCLTLFMLLGRIYKVENVSTIAGSTVRDDQNLQSLRKSFDDYDKLLLQEMNVDLGKQDDTKMDDDFISQWDQSDPRLIDHIRKKYLVAPDYTKPYNLRDDILDYSLYGASLIVNKTLGGRRNGFFIECGAYDGEEKSNSLMLEKSLNWTGLLIEPDPDNFERLLSRNRKAWLLNGGLHGGSKPKALVLHKLAYASVLDGYVDDKRKSFDAYIANNTIKATKVWCFPLLSILLAVGRTRVDYFSLDVEGAEYDILSALPLDKIQLNLLQMEYVKFEEGEKEQKAILLQNLMRERFSQFKEVAKTPIDVFYLNSEF